MPSSDRIPTLFRSARSDELVPRQHRLSIDESLSGVRNKSHHLLTEALLASYRDEFKAATDTPFLRLAGAGHISKSQLSRWLSQDRLYAETYICFIASLMARVGLPYAFVNDKSNSLRWRIVKLLASALENIHRELDFFTTTAEKYGLDLDHTDVGDTEAFQPNHATQQYIDLFRGFFIDPGLPLMEGMVVLWATEQCYLSSWTNASKFATSVPPSQDADGGALRGEFIPNWTSKEFQKFVDEIAEVTNMLAIREQAANKLEVYKAVWSHVLDIERRFWPAVEDLS